MDEGLPQLWSYPCFTPDLTLIQFSQSWLIDLKARVSAPKHSPRSWRPRTGLTLPPSSLGGIPVLAGNWEDWEWLWVALYGALEAPGAGFGVRDGVFGVC